VLGTVKAKFPTTLGITPLTLNVEELSVSPYVIRDAVRTPEMIGVIFPTITNCKLGLLVKLADCVGANPSTVGALYELRLASGPGNRLFVPAVVLVRPLTVTIFVVIDATLVALVTTRLPPLTVVVLV
jgi:hypothetical protein